MGPSPPPARRRVPTWLWILLGVVVVGALGLGALVLIGLDQALTHDLVDADFESSAEPFETGSNAEYSFALEDGTYRIAPTIDDPDGATYSFGEFARVAFAFELSADVVAIDDPPEAMAGIGCAETGTSVDSIFVFMAATLDGTSGYALVHLDSAEATPQILAEDTTGDGIRAGDSIGLTCRIDNPFGGSDQVVLTASVNGDPVLEATHDMRAADGFDAMVLSMYDVHAGHGVQFDDVTAHVPE